MARGGLSGSSRELPTLPASSPLPWPHQDGAAARPSAPKVFLFSVASCVTSPCVRVTVSGSSVRAAPLPPSAPALLSPCRDAWAARMLGLQGCSGCRRWGERGGPLHWSVLCSCVFNSNNPRTHARKNCNILHALRMVCAGVLCSHGGAPTKPAQISVLLKKSDLINEQLKTIRRKKNSFINKPAWAFPSL